MASVFPTFARGGNELLSVLLSKQQGLEHFYGCLFNSRLDKCYLTHDALTGVTWLCVAIIVYSFVWSVVGSNCSKVDQIWSITPWVFTWSFFGHYYYTHGKIHDRLLLVCVLTTLWGIRLTFNFARRGGYGNFFSHEEDYRWPILRKMFSSVDKTGILFLLFNISFIATYQNLLLLLIALPAYGVMKSPLVSIQNGDWAISLAFLILLVVETVADQQQWVFQNIKYSISESARKKSNDPDIRDGFLQSGLFHYTRHPNYFAEQAIWVCVYLFTLVGKSFAEPEALVNVYSLGAILLVLLFQGSLSFSEGITAGKYPAYKQYQQRVSQCIPLPFQFTSRDSNKKNDGPAPAAKRAPSRGRSKK